MFCAICNKISGKLCVFLSRDLHYMCFEFRNKSFIRDKEIRKKKRLSLEGNIYYLSRIFFLFFFKYFIKIVLVVYNFGVRI